MLIRRAAIAILASMLLWPQAGAAQSDRTRTIGILALGNPDPGTFIREFKQTLNELGHVEGTNIRFELRSAEGNSSRLEPLVRELVQMKVDVLVPFQTPAATVAKAATQEIPIVMASVADPVGSGLVKSLAQPGGNITGVTGMTSELGPKNLELIKEVMPRARRVAVLANEPDPFHKTLVARIQAAAAQLNIETMVVMARAGDDFDRHFANVKSWGADAVLLQPSLPLPQVVDSAAKARMPAFCPNSAYTDAGGLMSYSSDVSVVNKQAAVIVDKVLKGRKPEELPVEVTTKFRLVINAKAAAALGLEISPLLLTRADHVIE